MEILRDPDHAEIRACQDGSGDGFEAAFEVLFRRYRDRVYSIAYRITGSSADAMDVVQDSFSVLFRKIDSFRFDSLFSTWLFRIVVNCSIDLRRREHGRVRRAGVVGPLDGVDPVDPTSGPEGDAQVRELGDHVQESIQRLSPKLRAILVLRYLEGMSYEQLADTIEISMGTVKSRLARAHTALEKQLRKSVEAFGINPLGAEDRSRSDDDEGAQVQGGVA